MRMKIKKMTKIMRRIRRESEQEEDRRRGGMNAII